MTHVDISSDRTHHFGFSSRGDGERRSIMLKYVPFSPGLAGPRWLLHGSLHLESPHYMWQCSGKAGRGWLKGRNNGGSPKINRSPFKILWMNQLVPFCALLHFFCRPSKAGGWERNVGGTAGCLWRGKPNAWILPQCHQRCLYPDAPRCNRHVHTGAQIHLSPVVLWHWIVC